ncbi:malate dehydrogenase (quinone) [Verrucomicrobium sp. GAS474]|uniref:malate:quinone oxidoreductase n=1 Tax=Verrucomicrobium sp. GAS474 TaxID=1882831 RepID=UPI00087B013C|nr:malate:quinone oxidoreductase [Verrucomicrobium sp. GAS474]SDT86962.1 malate dehydrogenase (quinone) [Verrucomicrobium sp. GAS474]
MSCSSGTCGCSTKPNASQVIDVALIGGGIMSATLAALLRELEPTWKIALFERLDRPASESSDAWNNAGTGHAALCELNYTPEKADGSIDISKALKINESFEVTKQFWSSLVEAGKIPSPGAFLQRTPHMSFVRGEANVAYLRKRHAALTKNHLFAAMEYSEDPAVIAKWIPLVMEGRDPQEKIAATWYAEGTDVNFGALTRALLAEVEKSQGTFLRYRHEVRDVKRDASGHWALRIRDLDTNETGTVAARFVFLGAGGGALPLLQKSGIPEGKGFGGFPVSGQWLRCKNPDLIARHGAKVYGKASVGTPPMSVPHLDTRVIDGKKALLFGPYAGFSTKFLKQGSFLDLPLSIKPDNLWPMVKTGIDNVPLTQYLIGQVLQSWETRIDALREYFPNVKAEDWELEIAGQRVQVIKKDKEKGGVLQFGTEVICAGDGSLAALLGASPGASTAVPIMLEILKGCFKAQVGTPAWQEKLAKLIPSYGHSLEKDAALWGKIHAWTGKTLGVRAGGGDS